MVEIFNLMIHSIHFIYGYILKDQGRKPAAATTCATLSD